MTSHLNSFSILTAESLTSVATVGSATKFNAAVTVKESGSLLLDATAARLTPAPSMEDAASAAVQSLLAAPVAGALATMQQGLAAALDGDEGLTARVANHAISADSDLVAKQAQVAGDIAALSSVGQDGMIGPEGEKGEGGIVGATGPEGPQGAAGERGEQGPTGPEGASGPPGASGPQGLPGPTGPVGGKGANGPVGATGPQGDDGMVGAQGLQGVAGPDGEVGPVGDAGDLAYQMVDHLIPSAHDSIDIGTAASPIRNIYAHSVFLDANTLSLGDVSLSSTAGVLNIPVSSSAGGLSALGSSFRVAVFTDVLPTSNLAPQPPSLLTASGIYTPGDIAVVGRHLHFLKAVNSDAQESLVWVDAGELKGEKGAKGPAGLPGAKGLAGVRGVTGPVGDVGDVGATGAEGAEGAIGLKGETGPEGVIGEQGDTGPQGAEGARGDQGRTGAKGVVGPIGARGSTGAQGQQGPTGPIGLQGATGPQGVQGVQGPKGEKGATGPIGATSLTGARGLQGATGPKGATGPMGAPGSTGATGPQGAPGDMGVIGEQGVEGATGATGPQGFEGEAGDSPQGATGPYGRNVLGLDAPQAALVNRSNEVYVRASSPLAPLSYAMIFYGVASRPEYSWFAADSAATVSGWNFKNTAAGSKINYYFMDNMPSELVASATSAQMLAATAKRPDHPLDISKLGSFAVRVQINKVWANWANDLFLSLYSAPTGTSDKASWYHARSTNALTVGSVPDIVDGDVVVFVSRYASALPLSAFKTAPSDKVIEKTALPDGPSGGDSKFPNGTGFESGTDILYRLAFHTSSSAAQDSVDITVLSGMYSFNASTFTVDLA